MNSVQHRIRRKHSMCRFKPCFNRLCFLCMFVCHKAGDFKKQPLNCSCYTDLQNMIQSFSPTQVDGSVYQSLDTTLCIF